MRLGVSNLAWSAPAEDKAFALVAEAGFSGIEVAPTRIADWADLDAPKLDAYRRKCEAAGLVVSLAAGDLLQLPGSPAAGRRGQLRGHAGATAAGRRYWRGAGGGGSGVRRAAQPAARRAGARGGGRTSSGPAAPGWAMCCCPSGLALGMEPVPAYYGADFVESVADTAALVKACAHPSIRLHLDCACIQLGGDDAPAAVARYAGSAVHYHAAEPDLGPFAEPRCDHSAAAAALQAKGYDRWVVIEMRQQGEDGLAALGEALQLVGSTYGGTKAAPRAVEEGAL